MADDRPLYEVLLDYVLYAPIGLVATAAEELPRLSEVGRSRVGSQLKVAHVVGRLAVRQVQRRLGAHPPPAPRSPGGATISSERLREEPMPSPSPAVRDEPVVDPGAPPTPSSSPPRSPGASDASAGSGASNGSRPGRRARARPVPAGQPVEEPGDLPRADDLAIPGYDTLAASHVVQRLGSLEAAELEAVRRYESATRGRRTILHRIAQLAAADARPSA